MRDVCQMCAHVDIVVENGALYLQTIVVKRVRELVALVLRADSTSSGDDVTFAEYVVIGG